MKYENKASVIKMRQNYFFGKIVKMLVTYTSQYWKNINRQSNSIEKENFHFLKKKTKGKFSAKILLFYDMRHV